MPKKFQKPPEWGGVEIGKDALARYGAVEDLYRCGRCDVSLKLVKLSGYAHTNFLDVGRSEVMGTLIYVCSNCGKKYGAHLYPQDVEQTRNNPNWPKDEKGKPL